MGLNIGLAEILLLMAALIAIVSRRMHIPYTVGLLITGGALTLLPVFPIVHLTRELIFSVLLPPLIFEAALFLPWKELRKVMLVSTVMASLGLLLSSSITAVGMHYLLGWPPMAAAVFGALIAATDPISVIAAFKESGVTGPLRVLLESESLFNDGTAAVLFGLMTAIINGTEPTAINVLLKMGFTIGGGVACGAIMAGLLIYLVGRTSDHLVELTLTTVVAYGSFLIAEHYHCSGILATLTAGLIVNNRGSKNALSSKGWLAIEAFWEFAAFVANSLIFILIGMEEATQHFTSMFLPATVGIALVLLGRAFAIYPIAALFSASAYRLPASHQHVLVWGGLRGALALALALGLPENVPFRAQILTVTFAVVAFSVIVQGLTMTPLLRMFKLLPTSPPAGDYEGHDSQIKHPADSSTD